MTRYAGISAPGARRLKQAPAHGLHLRALPFLAERDTAQSHVALASKAPQGMCSTQKPVFKSLVRLVLASPRLQYHSIVAATPSSARLLATT